MTRVVFDFRTPTWTKWGVVIFASDAADRDRQMRQIGGDSAVIEIADEREATPADLARYAEYQRWSQGWQAAAKTASAGRPIASPALWKARP
jgi:hypothetical protein